MHEPGVCIYPSVNVPCVFPAILVAEDGPLHALLLDAQGGRVPVFSTQLVLSVGYVIHGLKGISAIRLLRLRCFPLWKCACDLGSFLPPRAVRGHK